MGGFFIVFEGPDGAGKSTQVAKLARSLDALVTREPGGTPAGSTLRSLLLDPAQPLCDRAEALLMAADRAQHVAEVIAPTLTSGRHVVCDRFTGSSVAYQGWGRGLDPAEVSALSEFAAAGLRPDLVVLLDVPAEVGELRRGGQPDRIEGEGRGFHERVRAGFLAQAEADPDRWVVIDGRDSVTAVAARVLDEATRRLGLPPRSTEGHRTGAPDVSAGREHRT